MGKVTNAGRTVANKGSDHIAAAIAPDRCYVGKKAKDFSNWVRSTELKKGQTTTVFIDKHAIWTSIGELGPLSEPAHAGKNGGVVSKTYRFEAKAISYSRDLYYENNLAVRTNDLTSQNHDNTVGRVVEGMSRLQLEAEFLAMLLFKRTPSWGKGVVIRKMWNQYVVIDHENKVFHITGDTLKIEGTPKFVQQTRRALYTLGDTRSGKVLFDDLLQTKHSVTIKQTSDLNGYANPSSWSDATNASKGSDTTIEWNPTFNRVPGEKNGPAIILGHELAHAHHNAKGIADTSPVEHNRYRDEERMTVGTSQTSIVDQSGQTVTVTDYSQVVPSENSFRQDLGNPPRPTYLPNNWPGGPRW